MARVIDRKSVNPRGAPPSEARMVCKSEIAAVIREKERKDHRKEKEVKKTGQDEKSNKRWQISNSRRVKAVSVSTFNSHRSTFTRPGHGIALREPRFAKWDNLASTPMLSKMSATTRGPAEYFRAKTLRS